MGPLRNQADLGWSQVAVKEGYIMSSITSMRPVLDYMLQNMAMVCIVEN